MQLRISTCLGIATLLLLLWQCANPIPPTGGPRDEQPPQIDSARSTPNLQTNFRPKTIELTFDEWVRLDQPNQQVVISPPLQGYQVRLKGRTVILDLGDEDTLRSNVTYVVQFGEAVKDLTEGNPAEDLRFVFSTGPYIDSLEVSGQLLDAYSSEPVAQALVMLYDNLADSVFRTNKPFYFGRTNEQGQFRISNLRAGDYKITALEDADANYRFNQLAERIAFLPEPITVSADTSERLQLLMFREELPLQLQEADSSQWGKLKLIFNRPPTEELSLESSQAYIRTNLTDSLLLWHKAERNWRLYVNADTILRDTIRVPAAPVARAAARQDTLRTVNRSGNPPVPGKPLVIHFNRPISNLDTSLISLQVDTLPERLPFAWEIDSTDQRTLKITRSLREQAIYRLELRPGAVTDFWGQSSLDTLLKTWTTSDRKSFGNLTLRFNNADSTKHYHVRVLLKDKPPVATFNYAGASSYSNELKLLPSGDYLLEIIDDRNANGRWDAGRYDTKQQPEPVSIKTLETLRANWDLEADIDLGSFFDRLND